VAQYSANETQESPRNIPLKARQFLGEQNACSP
jgi:hypothetical protein